MFRIKLVLLVALVSLATVCPVFAKSAYVAFLEKYGAQGLIQVNSNPDHGLIFAAGTSQANINAVTSAAQSFAWVDIPDPNVNQLEIDLYNDTATQSAVPYLMFYYPLLEKNYRVGATPTDVAYCQTIWAGLKANPPAWLSSALISAIETHAAANYVYLNPATVPAQ